MTNGAATSLSAAARKRGIAVIYANTFMMYGGFFMVIPMISVHYVNGLGWAASAIGLVLAVRQLVQQGLAFIGGVIADRIGAKTPIVIGLLVRAAGFIWMAYADTYPILMASAILAAAGGAFFESPKSAAGAALTTEAERPRFYAVLGVVGNLGLTLGPLAGAALLALDFAVVAFVAGLIFVLAGLGTILFLPPVAVSSGPQGRLLDGLVLAIKDVPFVVFTVLLMGFWFLGVQYNITLPLMATDLTGNESSAGIVLGAYAIVTVILQYPLLRLMERRYTPMTILTIGMVIMAAGLGLVAGAGTLAVLLVCSAIFAVGNVLAQPTQQTITARLANPRAYGSYFAVGGYAIAIGGSLGNFFGGRLYDWSATLDFEALPWLVFLAVGLLTALGMRWFASHLYPQPTAETADVAPDAPTDEPTAVAMPTKAAQPHGRR